MKQTHGNTGYGPVFLLIAFLTLGALSLMYRFDETFDPLGLKETEKIRQRLNSPVFREIEAIQEKQYRLAPLLLKASCGQGKFAKMLTTTETSFAFDNFEGIYDGAKNLNQQNCRILTRPEALP